MKEKRARGDVRARRRRMASFEKPLAPRCSAGLSDPVSSVCGEVALYASVNPDTGETRFYCAEHGRSGDAIIRDGTPIRVVRVSCEFLFGAVTTHRDGAQAEVIRRLELAALIAGAELSVSLVTSATGRYAPRGAATVTRAVRGPVGG